MGMTYFYLCFTCNRFGSVEEVRDDCVCPRCDARGLQFLKIERMMFKGAPDGMILLRRLEEANEIGYSKVSRFFDIECEDCGQHKLCCLFLLKRGYTKLICESCLAKIIKKESIKKENDV